MKTNLLILCFVSLTFFACKKNGDNTNPSTQTATYINTNAGSSWTYHEINSSGVAPTNTDYTVVSTAKDSSINGKSYHIYDYSYGGSEYLNLTGHNYYQYDSIPGGLNEVFERLYLKDDLAVGTNWKQDISVTIPGVAFPVPATITNTVAEKGISRNINGTNYSNVIHVATTITSALIPASSLTTSIDSYYAERFGLIENSTVVKLNFFGTTENVDISTKLTSAVLK